MNRNRNRAQLFMNSGNGVLQYYASSAKWLKEACMQGDENAQREYGVIREELLKQGIDMNIADAFVDGTALHSSVTLENTDMLRCLLANGADVRATDYCGRAPLHLAAWHGKAENALLLLNAGVEVDVTDNNGNTPLMEAAAKGRTATVYLLLDSGADSCAVNEYGETALTLAVSHRRQETAAILLDHPSLTEKAKLSLLGKLYSRDLVGESLPLRRYLLSCLISTGMPLGGFIDEGARKTLLHLLAGNGTVATADIELLLSHEPSLLNMTDQDGNTPLHGYLKRVPPRSVCLSGLRALVENGAEVNIVNGAGQTPLRIASLRGLDVADKLLKNAGADADLRLPETAFSASPA